MREFLHADDLGEACVFCLENWDPSCPNSLAIGMEKELSVLNVGTGVDCSIKDLAQESSQCSELQGINHVGSIYA